MAQEYASSVSASVIRLTRLTASGALATGPSSSYVSKSFISVSMTPEYEEGDEFIQKNANGDICVNVKKPNTLKRINLEIAICNPDPYFTELASGGDLLGNGKGWAAPAIGADPTPNGVAIEVWSNAYIDGKPAGTDPYFHWIFPYARLQQGGDRVIENGLLATSFEGWGVGNAAFDTGNTVAPWAYPEVAGRPYAYARTSTIPTLVGFNAA